MKPWSADVWYWILVAITPWPKSGHTQLNLSSWPNRATPRPHLTIKSRHDLRAKNLHRGPFRPHSEHGAINSHRGPVEYPIPATGRMPGGFASIKDTPRGRSKKSCVSLSFSLRPKPEMPAF